MAQNVEVLFTLNEGTQVVVHNNDTGKHSIYNQIDEDRMESIQYLLHYQKTMTNLEYDGKYYELDKEIKLQELEYVPPNYYQLVAERFFKDVDMTQIIENATVNVRSAKASPEDYTEDARLVVHVSTLVGESYGHYMELAVATAFGTIENNDDGEIDRDWFHEEADSMDMCIYDNEQVSQLVSDMIEKEANKAGLEGNFFFGYHDGTGYSLMYSEDIAGDEIDISTLNLTLERAFEDYVLYYDMDKDLGFEAQFDGGVFNGVITYCDHVDDDETEWTRVTDPTVYQFIKEKALADYMGVEENE